MHTSAECRKRAEQKLAEAERKPRQRKKLTGAAEAWLALGSIMEDFEKQEQSRRAKRAA